MRSDFKTSTCFTFCFQDSQKILLFLKSEDDVPLRSTAAWRKEIDIPTSRFYYSWTGKIYRENECSSYTECCRADFFVDFYNAFKRTTVVSNGERKIYIYPSDRVYLACKVGQLYQHQHPVLLLGESTWRRLLIFGAMQGDAVLGFFELNNWEMKS